MSVKRVWAPDAEPLDRVVVVLSRVSAVRIRSTATRGVRAEDVAGCRAARRIGVVQVAMHVDGARRRFSWRHGAHSRFPGHALTPTGVMAIRCKQFHLPDL